MRVCLTAEVLGLCNGEAEADRLAQGLHGKVEVKRSREVILTDGSNLQRLGRPRDVLAVSLAAHHLHVCMQRSGYYRAPLAVDASVATKTFTTLHSTNTGALATFPLENTVEIIRCGGMFQVLKPNERELFEGPFTGRTIACT